MCSQLARTGGRRDAVTAAATAAGLSGVDGAACPPCPAESDKEPPIDHGCAPAPTSTPDTLHYLHTHVLPSLNWPYERAPAPDFWVAPTAENKTVGEVREKVAAYLKSDEFKARLEALRSGVSGCLAGRGVVRVAVLCMCAHGQQEEHMAGLLGGLP